MSQIWSQRLGTKKLTALTDRLHLGWILAGKQKWAQGWEVTSQMDHAGLIAAISLQPSGTCCYFTAFPFSSFLLKFCPSFKGWFKLWLLCEVWCSGLSSSPKGLWHFPSLVHFTPKQDCYLLCVCVLHSQRKSLMHSFESRCFAIICWINWPLTEFALSSWGEPHVKLMKINTLARVGYSIASRYGMNLIVFNSFTHPKLCWLLSKTLELKPFISFSSWKLPSVVLTV